MSAAMTYLCIDSPCVRCGSRPQLRTCAGCGDRALITDCGHMPQPRPITKAQGLSYCKDCRDENAATVPS